MHVTVSHEAFATAVQTVSRAVPTRTTLPVLTGILLAAGDGGLTLTGTNLDLGVECRIQADVDRPGSIVLPARYLSDIARHTGGGYLELSVPEGSSVADIRWGVSQFTIHGHPADQFPALPRLDPVVDVSLPARELREVLEGTAFAASHDETRPILTGIQLTIRDGQLQALSTDGFRIALRRTATKAALARPAGLVIPGRNAAEFLHLRSQESVRLLATLNQALFDCGDVRFFSRLLDGTYPAVLDLVPKDFPTRIMVDRAAFLAACERVAILADPVQKAPVVTLTREDGLLALSSSLASVGAARDALPAEIAGADFQIIFNARFLADGLRNMPGEAAVLELSGPLTAARLTAAGRDDFLYILMPMRPSEGA